MGETDTHRGKRIKNVGIEERKKIHIGFSKNQIGFFPHTWSTSVMLMVVGIIGLFTRSL